MKINWGNYKLDSKTILFNYGFILLIFLLNFMGSPQLKIVGLAYTIFVYSAVFFLPFKTSILIILSYCFLEGQNRILWEYNPFFRLAFDGLIAVAIVRNWVVRRKENLGSPLPKAMLIFILLHFLWYAVEIFNIYSVSMFAHLAATKIYVFPFLIFILFRQNSDSFELEDIAKISTLVMFFILMESSLAIFQLQHVEKLMLEISPYYRKAMKDNVFIMQSFRPFGTTHLPGAVSIYLFLATGFMFLRRDFSKKFIALVLVIGSLALLTLIVCQVRSASVKYGLLVLSSTLAIILCSKQRLTLTVRISALALLFIGAGVYYFSAQLSGEDSIIDLEAGLSRWDNIDSYEDFKSKRAGPIEAFNIAVDRLADFPIGLGPGMTGATASLSADAIKSDPIYAKKIFWGFDNFYLSMVVEFGYGCIFYLLFIFSVPVVLFNRFRMLYKIGSMVEARIVFISFAHISVILIGNWGAIGLPYNPESFFFWFWSAIGMNTYTIVAKRLGLEGT